MHFKLAVSHQDAREIVGDGRVIKQAAILQLEQAVELARHFEDETAQRRADQIRSNEVAEQAGYDAGMQRAAQEYAGRLLEANQFIVQAASRFEASFAEAVRKAVARIVETVPDSSIVERLMFTAYQDTFNEQMARIVVHADHYERVVEAWQHRGGARAISIVGDPSVNHRFCRIESTLGSVEVDVDTAIEVVSDLVVRALTTARIEGKQVS